MADGLAVSKIVPTTGGAAPEKRVEISVSPRPQAPAIQIHTTEDLKMAELAGNNFPVGERQLIKAIEHANKVLQGRSTTFEFSIHSKTKEIMVKVLDKDTGEIIREIPPEKTLDMVAKLWEMAGILVDERR